MMKFVPQLLCLVLSFKGAVAQTSSPTNAPALVIAVNNTANSNGTPAPALVIAVNNTANSNGMPTLSPFNPAVALSDPPSSVPSKAPVSNSNTGMMMTPSNHSSGVPTKAPVSTSNTGMTRAPIVSPSSVPIPAPISPSNTGMTMMRSLSPSSIPSPAPVSAFGTNFTSPNNATMSNTGTDTMGTNTTNATISGPQCTDNKFCNALNLTGLCCPTTQNVSLDCCGAVVVPVQETCEMNPKCSALQLTGACCPTNDDIYLDCCTTVPNKCINVSSCTVFSAVQFKLDHASASSSGAGQKLSAGLATVVAFLAVVSM